MPETVAANKDTQILDHDIAFIVVSCDAYKDLWKPFFHSFFKYWPDFPYKVYLASNFATYDDPRVISANFGTDQDYSSNLLNILKNIEQEWVIIWYEDAFITKKVDTARIKAIINLGISQDVGYLKLTTDYPLYYAKSKDEVMGPIPKGVKYRSAMGMALYNVKTLKKLLVPGESAWQLDKSTRANDLDDKFYALASGLRHDQPFTIINSVIKGKWLREAPAFLKREGLEDLIPNRAVQALKPYLYIQLFLLRTELFIRFKKYWYDKPE